MSFTDGLGNFLGGTLASNALSNASAGVTNSVDQITAMQQPYQSFGQSFLSPTQSSLLDNSTVGAARLGSSGNNVQQFGDYMQNFQQSAGAKYLLGTATDAQNASAAAQGGVLSGANQRALTGIAEGVANTDALSQYSAYLQGNQQQFNQLQGTLQNLFSGIGVGQTANSQATQGITAGMQAQSQIAQAQAKADQSKGSGIGGMLGGLGGIATAF